MLECAQNDRALHTCIEYKDNTYCAINPKGIIYASTISKGE